MSKLRILAIGGPMAESLAQEGFPEGKIIVPDTIRPKARPESIDHIISYHVLQLVKNREIIPYLESYAKILKEDGTLTLFVPSLEWLAHEIAIAEEPSQMVKPHLWGNQTRPGDSHQSAHTMRTLRRDLGVAGIAVTHAKMGYYESQLVGTDGKAFNLDAGQNILIGVKKGHKSVPFSE